jgi:hypothetical protein
MKTISAVGKVTVRLGVIAAIALLCTGRAETQKPNLNATYGSVKLKAGFEPDPYTKEVVAGGTLQITKGGVTMYVAEAPDFKLYYDAGNFPLTIYAESKGDTTLLINLPDGTWAVDDDSGGNLNPLLKFAKPLSGRYDIWVGTIAKENPKAILKITELK